MGLLRKSDVGGLVKLAPDLTFPSAKTGGIARKQIIITNAAGSLTTALSLTGKFIVHGLLFDGLISESMTFKLTVDSEVIWNDTIATVASSENFLGGLNNAITGFSESIICNESLLLEVQTTTNNLIYLQYLARPIL